MLDKIYNKLHAAVSKPEERGEYSSGLWQDRIRVAALEQCALDQGRVLEIGCGEGLFLSKLAQRHPGIEAHGIDINETLLSRARERLARAAIRNVTLTFSDGATLPYPDQHFQAVICINVFFNLPTVEIFTQVMKEAIRVCRRGGYIVFDIRNRRNPLLALKYRFAKYYDETVRATNLPLRTYFLNQVTVLLRDHGCVVSRVDPLAFPRNGWSPIFVIRAKRIE